MKSKLVILSLLIAIVWASEGAAQDSDRHNDYWCTFFDALGAPIPQAKVCIYRVDDECEKPLLHETSTDEQGGLKNPGLGIRPSRCFFVVSHPNYGIAVAKKAPYEGFDRSAYCYVPVVARDSRDYKRSVRGVIRDADNKPVVGAKITCRVAIAPGDIWMSGLVGPYSVLSDSGGRFAMYLPLQMNFGTFEIPPHCEYPVLVEPPRDCALAVWSGRVSNDQPCSIVLENAEHFRTVAFEDANGPITDVEILKTISLGLRVPHYKSWHIPYPDFKHGLILPLGRVAAVMYGSEQYPPGLYEFEPIEVTADSPEQLVFKAKEKPAAKSILYTGQVVHGITGRPMAGAFVAAGNITGSDFSILRADQWQALHVLPSRPSLEDPALKPVLLVRPCTAIVRADEDGRFELTVSGGKCCDYIIIAFEEDYLAMHYYLQPGQQPDTDGQGIVEIPPLKLYPAATVLVEPAVAPPSVRINPKWELLENENVSWFEDFANEYGPAARYMTNLYLRANRSGRIHIPAGLDLRIRFRVLRSLTWDDRQWLPVLTKTIRAGQGETIDLGRVRFEQPMWIYVQALDSAGKPVVGIGVMYEKDPPRPHHLYDQMCITNEEGIAEFHVPHYGRGIVFVRCQDPNRGYVTESVSCQTNGRRTPTMSTRCSSRMKRSKLFSNRCGSKG